MTNMSIFFLSFFLPSSSSFLFIFIYLFIFNSSVVLDMVDE